ncbi:choice-of-anchor L domain-containing protein, partial [Neptunitalea lumnitzerae]|uniref:choice-of-anchor L domain-containing protein n=1 Tax=Neptunitalea lumnitzerae TaxID=2965509 RepID=UPI002493CD44
MKKTTLLILLLLVSTFGFSQVLNDAANWPNVAWSITGSYGTAAGLFEADPTVDSNFAFDDNQAGSGVTNNIAAESSYMDLTGAFVSGETFIYVDLSYIYNQQNSEILALQYWDFDASAWVTWDNLPDTGSTVGNTGSTAGNVYCADVAHQIDYTSSGLDISSFSSTQLAGFRYRILFDDNNIWAKGFCISSPTIYSQSCPPIANTSVSGITDTTVAISWTAGGTETEWEVTVQPAGTGTPTGSGTVANTNTDFEVTGLTADTDYEIYIRANCGGSDYSTWVGPFTFTTYAVPPTAPTGVTCTTGSASFIFTEDFDSNIGGWTGNLNSGGGSWEIPDGATSAGTGAANAYSGASFMNFEASGANPANPGSIVSPVIDLSGATGAVELSFFMHAYGVGMGTLEVGIGTAVTGPFTNEFTWVGQYQTSANQDWVPVGIDLTAYAGQLIYIEFRQTGTGLPTGDMSIDYVRVQSCGTYCIAPSTLAATNITDTSADLSWVPNNGETSWEYVVQPAGTGVPSGAGTVVNTTPTVQETGLTPDTAYEVYVRADCGGGFYSDWSYVYTFTTEIQTEFIVDCAVGPTNVTYCWGNNDNTMFTFTATDQTLYLTAMFNSGTVGSGDDEIIIYDSDGTTILYQGYGNSGDLAGLEIQSTGSTIYVQIQSNGSDSCASGTFTSLDFDVICNTCLNHAVTYTSIDDCNNQQYYVDVDITDMGDATSLTILDDQNSTPQIATATGTYTFGPYPLGTDVYLTVNNTNDPNCTDMSPNMNDSSCPPMNVSTTQYTADQLVTDVLMNSGCAQVFNVQYSTGTNFGSDNGIGYFYNAYNFPVQSGVVLTSGDANAVPGPNIVTPALSNGGSTWPSDPDLVAISGPGYNATVLEFDFIPLTSNMSFDFIFASEEYTSTFECSYSDTFAFFLTDAAGNTTNLAVIPGTTIPVTVVNVHGGIGSCGPANAAYFDQYNANGTGEIDFNGQTVLMTAQSAVTPGQTYHIKLAIQDDSDSSWDSAVFIAAGSFDIGDIDLGEDILLTGGNANCEGDVVTIDTANTSITPGGVLQWYQDGVAIPGATGTTLDVTETGTYGLSVTYPGSSCSLEGDILIEFFPLPEPIVTPDVITKSACLEEDVTVTVTNISELLGNLTYIFYDENGNVLQSGPSDTYTLSGDIDNPEDGIFTVEVIDDTNNCSGTTQFEVILDGYVFAGQPDDIEACDDISNDGYAEFDLTTQDAAVIDGATDVVVTYYEDETDALNGVNAIPTPEAYTNTDASLETIYARLESTVSACPDVVAFDLIIHNSPILDFAPYYDVCSNGITATTLTPNILGFNVTDPGVTFTWSQDGTVLATETGSTLDVLDAGLYAVEVTTEYCTNYFEVLVEEADDCFIPQGISPGGTSPGQNDTFDLDGFNVAKLQIFNRLGAEIYTFSNYTDEWYGQDD